MEQCADAMAAASSGSAALRAVRSAAGGREGRTSAGRRRPVVTGRRRTDASPLRCCGSGGDALCTGIPSLRGLVDQIVGDARTRERDDALGEEIRAARHCAGRAPRVRVRPSRACRRSGGRRCGSAHLRRDASRRRGRLRGPGPRRRYLALDASRAGADDTALCVAGLLAACHRHEGSLGQEGPRSRGPCGHAGSRGHRSCRRSELAGLGGVADPRRGRQTSPVSMRYCSASGIAESARRRRGGRRGSGRGR